jgi:hypothetical protein
VKRELEMTKLFGRVERVLAEILVRAREQTERLLIGVSFAGELDEDLVRATTRAGPRKRQRQELAKPCIGGKPLQAVGQDVVRKQRRPAFEPLFTLDAVRGSCLEWDGGCQMLYFGLALRSSAI